MTKILYLMSEPVLKKYTQIKSEMIAAREGMTASEVESAKAEILQECKINDFDPGESELSNTDFYTVENGVAKIPIEGMLVNKINFCDAFFGETLTTYKFIREASRRADKDPAVNKIAFMNNSGGGVVSGVDITAETIRSLEKPTFAVLFDMSASADYWLSSATDDIISVSRTGFVGSIGVAVEIVTRDKQDEQAGIKRIVLTNTTSKDKRPDLMTDEGQAILVEEMDALFDVFVDSILIKRSDKITRESIEGLAGKVLISSKALEAGLTDRFMTEKEADAYILGKDLQIRVITPVSGKKINKEYSNMNLTEFLESNPEAKVEHEKLIGSAKTEGIENAVAADRERFAEVLNLSGVKVPENVMKDAKNGLTVAEFAVNELKTRNEAIVKQGSNSSAMGGLSTDGQLPEKVTEKTVEEQKDKSAEDSVAKYLKKTGGEK